jgi:hypothetical protein
VLSGPEGAPLEKQALERVAELVVTWLILIGDVLMHIDGDRRTITPWA